MTLPVHVADQLTTAGDLTTDRVTTKPRERRCPTCRVLCLVAIPDLRSGAHWITHHPTTTYGELLALTTGARTYDVQRAEVRVRNAEQITAINADHSGRIHVQHLCGHSSPQHPNYSFEDVTFTGQWWMKPRYSKPTF